jgi:hypothetical protein
MDKSALVNLLFSGSTAFAGLILIFLGGMIVAYEAYETTARSFVRKKYLIRTWLSFSGFLSAILSALAALSWYWLDSINVINLSLAAFLASCLILVVVAILAVKEV